MTYLEWPRRVAALGQFHVVDPSTPVLPKDDEHHLRKVLRARNGEEVVVTDGKGTWSLALVQEHGLERSSDVHTDPPRAQTTLYLVPLKGDRSEWAVAKATELGVTTTVPLMSERMNVKLRGEARDKLLHRWRRIAEESAGQCRRTDDMVIADPMAIADVPVDVAVADFDGSGDWSGVTSVAIGPEGGWADDEWGSERKRLQLGPTVLRGETAGIAAATLLTFPAGGWGFTVGADQSE